MDFFLPLWPPAASPAVTKNNGFYSWREGTLSDPPPHTVALLASRQMTGRVASGLCALSVIKERKKVYGLLVSEPPTDGMSSKNPPNPNLWRVKEAE